MNRRIEPNHAVNVGAPVAPSGIAHKIAHINNLLDELLGSTSNAHSAFSPVLRHANDTASCAPSATATVATSPMEDELTSIAIRIGMAIGSIDDLVSRNTL